MRLGTATPFVRGGGPVAASGTAGGAQCDSGREFGGPAFQPGRGRRARCVASDGRQLWLLLFKGEANAGPTLQGTPTAQADGAAGMPFNLDGGGSTGLMVGGAMTGWAVESSAFRFPPNWSGLVPRIPVNADSFPYTLSESPDAEGTDRPTLSAAAAC